MNIKKIKKSKIEIYVRGDATAHKSGTNMSASLISNSLTITNNKNTKSATFDIGLSYQPIDYLDYGYNVQIYIDDILFFGGYISATKTDILYKVIKIECVSHNTLMYHRLNINNFDFGGNIADVDHIGDYVSMIYDRYLKAYGKGTIHDGIAIDDIDFDIYQYKNNYIHDILDDFALIAAQNNTNLGALGAYRWGITDDGIFYFMRQKELSDKNDWLTNSDYYITDNNATIDFSLSSGYHDYRNVQVILGGYPDDDVSDSNLTDDGKIFYIKKNQDEIDKVKSRLHNNGIFESVYEDSTISTIKGADAMASQLLDEYGHIERVLEIKTFEEKLQRFEIGDKVKVSIQKMQGEYEDKISSELYIVQNKTIVDIDDGRIEIMYTLYKYGTSNNRTNFYDYLKPTKQTNTQKSEIIKLPSKLRKAMKIYWVDDERNKYSNGASLSSIINDTQFMTKFYIEKSEEVYKVINRTFHKGHRTISKDSLKKGSDNLYLPFEHIVINNNYIKEDFYYKNLKFLRNVGRVKYIDDKKGLELIHYSMYGFGLSSKSKYFVTLGYKRPFDIDKGFILGRHDINNRKYTGYGRLITGNLDYIKTKEETAYIKDSIKPNDNVNSNNNAQKFKVGKYSLMSINLTTQDIPRLTTFSVDTNILSQFAYQDTTDDGIYHLPHDYYILGFVEIEESLTEQEEDLILQYFDSLMGKKYDMPAIMDSINKIDAEQIVINEHKDL